MKQIKTLKALDAILQDRKSHDFALMLNGGLMSKKTITYKPHTYHILNHIDNTRQHLVNYELNNPEITNIGRAMKKGAFYLLD